MDIVNTIENAPTNPGDRPKEAIKIAKSGELKEGDESAAATSETTAEATTEGTVKEEL